MIAGNHTGPIGTAGPGTPWRLELFGGLRLWHTGNLIERFSTRKTAGVLAYLASHRGKAISRDTLADVFWPDTDPESARNSLRVALNALRKLLATENSADILQTDRLTVRLDPAAFSTDLADFETTLREEARAGTLAEKIDLAARAHSLYRGPFLDGWYEEWVDSEQNRLAEGHRNVLHRLTSYLLEARDYERALDFASQAVHSDPLREESHRLVIRLHMAMGNPTAAMQQYRELERILRKELGAVPSGATRDLLRQSSPVSAPSAPATGKTTATGAIPQTLTPFFGREEEMARLMALLAPDTDAFAPRLVTLTGLGGSGKSRLAIEVALKLRHTFGGQIWFVPLVGISQPAQIGAAMASALRIPSPADQSPNDQIVQALAGKRTLLVLENFEQAVEASCEWLRNLLQRLPLLTCLVTTRYRLGITGEQEIPLTPLPVPTVSDIEAASPERLAAVPSVALFVDRARAARPDFRLTGQNAATVAAICAALDGLPLAIELAAAWTRLLSPVEMRNRLRERFDLLVSSSHDLPPRHRSLRAVLDASYHLLTDEEKEFFARLSVFRDGWNLTAAEAVTDVPNVFDRLNTLHQRSLLLFTEADGFSRFRMLETVREYAAEFLPEGTRPPLRGRHAAHYVNVTEEAARFFGGADAEQGLQMLDREEENLREALSFLLEAPETQEEGIRLVALLWRFWYARGHLEEGMQWLEKALRPETEAIPAPIRIALREGIGRFSISLGQNTLATRWLRQALDIAQVHVPAYVPCLAMNLGLAAQSGSDAETVGFAFRILAECKRKEGDLWAEAAALAEVGKALRTTGDPAEREAVLARARILRQGIGDDWGVNEIDSLLSGEEPPMFSPSEIGPVYLTLGAIAAQQGDHAIAFPLLRDALNSFREQKNDAAIATTLERLGLSALGSGDYRTARTVLEEAISLRRDGNGREAIPFCEKLLNQALFTLSPTVSA
ncbi:MAG: BTAD domain-containing putative transcriptional regulator [Capsulimonadales bacterium]|nr:BTAD domain-containing putative transcriptional regulator [Capsulimonadales bacterium]